MTAPPHLLSEYEDVQPIHRRILAFSFIGWIFDFYDLLLLSFVVASTSLTKDLALSAYDVSVLLGTALAFTAVGGLAGGALADRFGRKPLLMISADSRSISPHCCCSWINSGRSSDTSVSATPAISSAAVRASPRFRSSRRSA